MTRPCANKNLLVRSGMTQPGRQLQELQRDHFQPDERDLPDLILFGQRFAAHVRYYDGGNQADGDWQAFFHSDVTASLAALARLPVAEFRSCQLDLENWLKAEPHRNGDELAAHARLLFFLPLVLLEQCASHQARLPADHAFRHSLGELAVRELGEPLYGLASWFKGAQDDVPPMLQVFGDEPLDLAQYNTAGAPGDSRLRLSSTIVAALRALMQQLQQAIPPEQLSLASIPSASLLAGLDSDGWPGIYLNAEPDNSPWLDGALQPHARYEQIYDAISYNLLSTSIERIYQALERIRRDAVSHLQDSLTAFAAHAPHYGLWLTFLQLFRHAQGELNQFTGRHLDFYFRQVLRLDNRAAQPDHAHLLFELAKGVEHHLLPAGTAFRAGKDALGVPLGYQLDEDIVINRGVVQELRGLQLIRAGSSHSPTLTPLAASVVPSRDGLGEVELAKDAPLFPPFGPAASPAARIGFSIADRKLFLREGQRSVQIRAILPSPLASTDINPGWKVRLSGEKGWFELSGSSRISTLLDNSFTTLLPQDTRPQRKGREAFRGFGKRNSKRRTRTQHILQIELSLLPEDPPIIPLDSKLHGDDYPPGLPVCEISFDFAAAGSSRAFEVLHDIRFSELSLRTSASGLNNLMVVGGNAVADLAKPFAPFGNQPPAGAFFNIGSSEIFSKPIASWKLELDWAEPYDSNSHFRKLAPASYQTSAAVLSGGQWLPSTSLDLKLGQTSVSVSMPGASLIDSQSAQTLDNPPLLATSINGFARLRLPLDFGHPIHPRINTLAMLQLSGSGSASRSIADWVQKMKRPQELEFELRLPVINLYNYEDGLPKAPYDPKITRLQASYQTTRDSVQRFALLHPFGLSATSTRRLFPALPFQGALLIGIAGFAAPAKLTLLIQVADGSGDPLRSPPALSFHYLSGDAWHALDEQDVDDRTRNFSTSGVLGLNLPEQADSRHRVMPDGLHWIRISCASDADALNRLLSVDAQAARVSFVDAGNDPAHLATPLAAGSIGKLLVPDLAVKKVSQPWNSFGGRPRESDAAFATRVSERLRHKDRAITLWDYEALVLEAFPRLYRVKCLGTTELQRNASQQIIGDNEQMPGAVTVVTVPWTHGQNSRDPLRPYTDQATLGAVETFLRKRISPFVRLTVQNPKFEEVKLDFRVKFLPGVGDIAFHIEQLNQALTGFLTPWSRPGGGEITFGGRLWKSTIIDFIEEQPKVDYITDVRLYHKVDISAGEGEWTPVDLELIETTSARSILVSASRHNIHEVPGNG